MSSNSPTIRSVAASLEKGRELCPRLGVEPMTTADRVQLMKDLRMYPTERELPGRYAALMVPVFGYRVLVIGSHVSRLARHLVCLHEIGHCLQRTDRLGIAYDADDWRTPRELAADTFAAVALFPKTTIDEMLRTRVWVREVEDEIAAELRWMSDGLWDYDRALASARNRLIIREGCGC